jgi:hypothetical protein
MMGRGVDGMGEEDCMYDFGVKLERRGPLIRPRYW